MPEKKTIIYYFKNVLNALFRDVTLDVIVEKKSFARLLRQNDRGGTRTRNLQIRSLTRYPLRHSTTIPLEGILRNININYTILCLVKCFVLFCRMRKAF